MQMSGRTNRESNELSRFTSGASSLAIRNGVGQPGKGAMKVCTYLLVSGLFLLLLLHVVCKAWQNAVEIHSATHNLDNVRGSAASRDHAVNDRERVASRTGWLKNSPPKYCHVW
jgi:hypothetical protein